MGLPSAADLAPDIAARTEHATERLRELPGSSDDFRPAGVDAIREAGLHRLMLPAADGGQGAGMHDAVEVLAAIAAVDASLALGLAMQTQVLGAAVETRGWPEAPFRRLVAAVRDEGAFVNAASTEEGSGSPARGGLPATRAVKHDGATFHLSGEKTFTTWLPVLRFAVVTALMADERQADGEADDRAPFIGTFLVDLELPGVERLPGFDALGMRGTASGRLVLRDVAVPSDMLIHVRQAGAPDPRGPSAQAWFAMCLAGTYLGIGEGARSAVTNWAIDRRPGDGSRPVADLPTVQVRLGRLDAALRTARIVLTDVARRWDAARPTERAVLVPDVMLAKISATNASVLATDEALRIAGGPGFVAGPIERAFRDARAGLINPPLDDIAYQAFAAALVERAGAPG